MAWALACSAQEPTPAAGDAPPCFPVQRIELAGEAAGLFQWALQAAEPSGRCLYAPGINLAMRRIQNAIVERGFVTTRVLAMPQDLRGGILQLVLVPGRVRRVRFADGTGPRATAWNAVPAEPGALLNLRDLEQALENFKRVPTVEAGIEITPAEGDADGAPLQPGDSDLVVSWRQPSMLRLGLSADDSGTRATGRYQGSATLSIDHALALNDLAYLTLLRDLGGDGPGARGTRGHALHYSLPLGYWLLALNQGASRYHQSVAGATQAYVYSGESRSADIKASRILRRDASAKLTGWVRGWYRASTNAIDDVEVEVQRRRTAGWEVGLLHQQSFEAATVEASLAYRQGTGALDALPAPEDGFGEGASRPRIASADVSLVLPLAALSPRLSYSANWRGQASATPLVPQDRFTIGGRQTVRGFDGENVLSAQRGWLLRNELAWRFGDPGVQGFLGIDHGRVGGAGSASLAGTRLSGAVIGLRGAAGPLQYEAFAGGPLQRPAALRTAQAVAGFSVFASF